MDRHVKRAHFDKATVSSCKTDSADAVTGAEYCELLLVDRAITPMKQMRMRNSKNKFATIIIKTKQGFRV